MVDLCLLGGPQMPDVAIVVRNGAVRGEETGLGDIDHAAAGPAGRINCVISKRLILAHDIGTKVGQGKSEKYDNDDK